MRPQGSSRTVQIDCPLGSGYVAPPQRPAMSPERGSAFLASDRVTLLLVSWSFAAVELGVGTTPAENYNDAVKLADATTRSCQVAANAAVPQVSEAKYETGRH
jgi:hypothetical protein